MHHCILLSWYEYAVTFVQVELDKLILILKGQNKFNEKGLLKFIQCLITENILHEQLCLANDKITTPYLVKGNKCFKIYQQEGSFPLLNKIGSNHMNMTVSMLESWWLGIKAFIVSNCLHVLFLKAISELPFAFISKQVYVQNHSNGTDFDLLENGPVGETHFHMNGPNSS